MFDDKLPERLAKELAWTTFAVLRNTNTCTLLIVKGGKVLVARGALGVQTIDAANPRASLPRVQSAVQVRRLANCVFLVKSIGSGLIALTCRPHRHK